MTEYGTKECKHCHKSFKGLAFYNHTCIKGSFEEELFGRGPGDPDVYGYPGEKPANIRYIGEDRATVQRNYPTTTRREGWPWAADVMDYDPRIDEEMEESNV